MNPALDRTFQVDKLVFDDRIYSRSMMETAGGRGINASRVLHSFGAPTRAILMAGGKIGDQIAAKLATAGFENVVVRTSSASRINLTVSDSQGMALKLNEIGPKVRASEIQQVRDAVEKNLEGATWLMLCGSLPPGVPAKFYADMIELARARGVKTLLDADDDALQLGVIQGPTVVKPNLQETERLLHRALISKSQFVDAARRIQELGANSVILSLGARGAVAVSGREMIEAVPPRVDVLCPIGAGDAMSAAFCWAMSGGKAFSDSVRWGVAAGTASAELPGIEFASLEQVRAMYKSIEMRELD